MNKDDKISIVDTTELEEKIEIIMRQTDYTKDIAREKLIIHEYDTMKCIRDYLGVTEKKAPTMSVNQQIYKELRNKLGSVELPEPVKLE
jgi:hypothetical protein